MGEIQSASAGICRVVFIPFALSQASLTPVKKWQRDSQLAKAIDSACAVALILMHLWKSLFNEKEYSKVVSKVTALVPPSTSQKINVSYSLLLFATIKVYIYIHHDQAPTSNDYQCTLSYMNCHYHNWLTVTIFLTL